MMKRIIPAAAILLILSACAGPRKELDANPAFSSHQYRYADLQVSWKSGKTDHTFHIEGVVNNPRPDVPIHYLDLTANLLDETGKIFAKQTNTISIAPFKDTQAFTMDIPLEKNELPTRIKFSYKYSIEEDNYFVNFVSVP